MDITELLAFSVQQGASDLHLPAGLPPMIRVDGDVRRVNVPAQDHAEVQALVYDIMNDRQRKDFEEFLETDFSFEVSGVARFRVNAFNQNRGAGAVFRMIPSEVLSMETLGMGQVFREISMIPRGLVLVTGPTGSGKSTTLASLIDHRNSTMGGHIVTIEDPVEFIHRHKQSIVNQRELGVDTRSWENALKNTLRQAPDVIYIGEIRDRATIEYAVSFAETGHLCISTLHADNANQALERIVNFFPEERRPQLLMDLSLNLLGIMSQRLIPTAEGGRCAAIEVLLASPLVKDLILQGDIHALKDIMEKSIDQGMKTFDQALFSLYHEGKITQEEAMRNADSANNLRLKIKLASEGGAGGVGGLSLEETD